MLAIVNHIQAVKEFSLISYISPQAIGLGVVLGHIFPIYYKFKGGKGADLYSGFNNFN
nr:glycerol-3-phosphate acyltransferase [Mycoplasmopsis bovis]